MTSSSLLGTRPVIRSFTEALVKASLHVRPRHSPYSIRVQVRHARANFLVPLAFRVLIDRCIDAFQQRISQLGTRLSGKRKSFFKELASVFHHASIVVT